MNSLCVPAAQLRDTMSRLAYFRGWQADLVTRLAANAMQFSAQKDSLLLSRGERPQNMYVLISGQIRLFIPLANAMERVVTLIAPGEGFGEAPLLTDSALPYSVTACRDSHVLAINSHAYLRALNEVPSMMTATLNQIARRLVTTQNDLDLCSQPYSMQRVIHFLLTHQPADHIDDFNIALPARKRDIAAKLGLTQETFSRALGQLGLLGLLSVHCSQVRIHSASALRKMDISFCDKGARKTRNLSLVNL